MKSRADVAWEAGQPLPLGLIDVAGAQGRRSARARTAGDRSRVAWFRVRWRQGSLATAKLCGAVWPVRFTLTRWSAWYGCWRVNEAFDLMHAGTVIRSVLDLPRRVKLVLSGRSMRTRLGTIRTIAAVQRWSIK